jgi:hypothetical protein
MINPIKIAIAGLDNTEAVFAAVQKRFRKLSATIDKVKNRFPLLSASFAKVGGFLKSAISSIVKSALAMGAAFTVALSAITIKTMSSIDALGKMSSKIGTTAGSLAKLQFAAEQTGVSAETMGMAMQRFTRRAAEAARGTGEAKGALKELNLSAAELIKMPLEDQVLALSKSFDNVETSADKVRLAMKLFDSEGVALVNTLGAGSDGLQAMFNDAEALGLVLSEDAVDGVEAANDSMNRLKTLFVGFSRQAVAAFAPAIDEIAKSLTELGLTAADGDVQNIGEVIAKSIVSGLISVIEVIEKMMNAFGQMAHKIQAIYKSFFPDEEMKKDQERVTEIVGILGQLGRGNSISGKALFADIPALKAELAALQESLSGGEFVPFDFSALIEKLLEVNNAIESVKDSVEEINEVAVKAIDGRDWFRKLIDSALDFKDIAGEAFGRVAGQVFDFDSAMNSLVTGSIDAMVQGFSDMMTGAKSFGDAMKDMAKTVIDALMKMYIKYLIVQPLFDMMFPGKRPGSEGYAPKALGGPVQANTPYLVGERGPELFMPNSGGNIIPNNKMGGGGSSVVVQQTINVTTGVQQTVRAEIVQLMPQIAQAAKGAVVDARLRGGNFSKAMAGA